MTTYLRSVLAVSVVLAWVSAVPALPWTETGDAGALPDTAQFTLGAGAGPLTSISGTLSATDLTQEDMFVIQVTDPLAFSATTVGMVGTLEDMQLFLFDAVGRGVYANDDAGPFTGRSTLPTDRPPGPLTPGLYFLAISGFDRDPESSAGLIFPADIGPGVFEPNGLGSGAPISSWSGASSQFGSYTILLTGADPVPLSVPPGGVPTPEPSTIILLGTFVSVGVIYARRRQRQTVHKSLIDG